MSQEFFAGVTQNTWSLEFELFLNLNPEILREKVKLYLPSNRLKNITVDQYMEIYSSKYYTRWRWQLRRYQVLFLIDASQDGCLEIVKLLLEQETQPEIFDLRWMLECANQKGHADLVKFLLEKYKINSDLFTDEDVGTALTYASHNGDLNLVEYLLGPNFVISKEYHNHALRCACEGGHFTIVNVLLDAKADDYSGALRESVLGGHLQIVKLMVAKGAYITNGVLGLATRRPNILRYLTSIVEAKS